MGKVLCIVVVLGLSTIGKGAVLSQGGERRATPAGAESATPQATPQEQFLQQFISRSLVETQAESKRPETLQARQEMTTQGTPALPPEQAPPVPQIPHQLTTAATTMLLALGAILCCLIVGAYVVRRYLLTHTLLGTRTTPLRVLARTYITPKAAVALLEVPGKLLVIGIAGGTMVALGEVTAASPSSETNTPSSPSIPSTSFATTLTQSAQQFIRQDEADATPLQVSERIQQKVSRLKQL